MNTIYWYGYGWKTRTDAALFMESALSACDISCAELPRVVGYDTANGRRFGIQVQHD